MEELDCNQCKAPEAVHGEGLEGLWPSLPTANSVH